MAWGNKIKEHKPYIGKTGSGRGGGLAALGLIVIPFLIIAHLNKKAQEDRYIKDMSDAYALYDLREAEAIGVLAGSCFLSFIALIIMVATAIYGYLPEALVVGMSALVIVVGGYLGYRISLPIATKKEYLAVRDEMEAKNDGMWVPGVKVEEEIIMRKYQKKPKDKAKEVPYQYK